MFQVNVSAAAATPLNTANAVSSEFAVAAMVFVVLEPVFVILLSIRDAQITRLKRKLAALQSDVPALTPPAPVPMQTPIRYSLKTVGAAVKARAKAELVARAARLAARIHPPSAHD